MTMELIWCSVCHPRSYVYVCVNISQKWARYDIYYVQWLWSWRDVLYVTLDLMYICENFWKVSSRRHLLCTTALQMIWCSVCHPRSYVCVCEYFSKVSLLRYLLSTMTMELTWPKISGQLISQTHTQTHAHAQTCLWEFLNSELTKIFTVYNDHDIVNI